jgi:membrane-associated PAP2 superfamily phosphatase
MTRPEVAAMDDDPSAPGSEAILRAPPRSPGVDPRSYVALHLVAVPLVLAALAWACQHSSLDMALTRLFVDPATDRFAWRDSAVLEVLGHQAARGLPFLVGTLALAAGLAGFSLRALRPWTPILLTLGAAMLLGPLTVNLLKGMTTQHCPSALQSFGGVVDYVAERNGPFWASSTHNAGHCLPSGHAGGGYALLALYFGGWAAGRTDWRWRGLAIGISAGLLFSIVRMMQGSHFASATLWSAAVDWTICAALFLPLLCTPTKRRA